MVSAACTASLADRARRSRVTGKPQSASTVLLSRSLRVGRFAVLAATMSGWGTAACIAFTGGRPTHTLQKRCSAAMPRAAAPGVWNKGTMLRRSMDFFSPSSALPGQTAINIFDDVAASLMKS